MLQNTVAIETLFDYNTRETLTQEKQNVKHKTRQLKPEIKRSY